MRISSSSKPKDHAEASASVESHKMPRSFDFINSTQDTSGDPVEKFLAAAFGTTFLRDLASHNQKRIHQTS